MEGVVVAVAVAVGGGGGGGGGGGSRQEHKMADISLLALEEEEAWQSEELPDSMKVHRWGHRSKRRGQDRLAEEEGAQVEGAGRPGRAGSVDEGPSVPGAVCTVTDREL